jgi:small subunit ribosomal protein S15
MTAIIQKKDQNAPHVMALIQKYQKHATDVGSSAVQVIQWTQQILWIASHSRSNPKDHHCKRGLMRAVNARKKHLAYLRHHENACYAQLIQDLGLRH